MKEFLSMGNETSLRENKTIFIPCECRSEILVIEYDHEWAIADLAIYQTEAAYKAKLSLWQRFRYCWQVLVHKKPYADQIVLNSKQLNELKFFLQNLS